VSAQPLYLSERCVVATLKKMSAALMALIGVLVAVGTIMGGRIEAAPEGTIDSALLA
jgi:hypothetical protein